MSEWEDLVTVALLGTDRRPVPEALPASWAGRPGDHSTDPTGVVLAYAARHRAAVRAGARAPTGALPPPAPPFDRQPAPPEAQQELADALAIGSVGHINQALTELVEQGGMAAELWAAAAAAASESPRVDRAALAEALGVRGVWFVERNPSWSRLAATLRTALSGVQR
jgi:hypothetical protein